MAEIKIDCFGVRSDSVRFESAKVNDPFMHRLKGEFNKETGQFDIIADEPINLDEMTQSYKDECGEEIVKRMRARGEDISIFADDGKHSADLTGLVNFELAESARQIDYQKSIVEKIASALGIDLNDHDNLESNIKEALSKSMTKETKENE